MIYGKECVILLTACLKESKSESRMTSSGNLFHKTMDNGKKENLQQYESACRKESACGK